MITIEEVEKYLKLAVTNSVTANKYIYYKQSVDEKKQIADTFSKVAPDWLIAERPKETLEQKKFRKDLYERIGNNIVGYKNRILTKIKGIRSISDYKVLFNRNDNQFDIYDYVNNEYPMYRNYVNYFWDNVPKRLIDDANSLIYALPNEKGEKDLSQPTIHFVGCENVLNYQDGLQAVFISESKSDIIDDNGKLLPKSGIILVILDNDSYVVCKQTKKIRVDNSTKTSLFFDITGLTTITVDGTNEVIEVLIPPPHYCRYMPCSIIGVDRIEINESGNIICKSIIADAIPDLRRAISLSMDLAIEYAYHSATEEWRTVSETCKSCNGTGTVGHGKEEKPCSAKGCVNGSIMPTGTTGNGLGMTLVPNYPVKSSDLPMANNRNSSIPIVGGFIQRNLESSKLFAEALDKHIERAFMWSNMEYLFKNQIQQSGEHLGLQKEDSEHFILVIAQHICLNLLQPTLQWITEMRYPNKSNDELQKTMTMVRPPLRFNLESSDVIFKNLQEAVKVELDSNIVNNLTLDYFEKAFGINSYEYQSAKLSIKVNPLSGKTDLDKARAMPTLEWWESVMVEQCDYFIRQSLEEDNLFFELEELKQIEIITNKAKAKALLTLENKDRQYIVRPEVKVIEDKL